MLESSSYSHLKSFRPPARNPSNIALESTQTTFASAFPILLSFFLPFYTRSPYFYHSSHFCHITGQSSPRVIMTSLKFEMARPIGRKTYRPGDVVSGLVHLDLSHDAAQNAKRIEVAFSGRSEINCTTRTSEWNGKAPWHGNLRTVFFDELQVVCVYDASHLPVLGNTQWPFSFVFPALTSSNQQLRKWGTSINLPTTASEPDVPLPPSFFHEKDNWTPSDISEWNGAAQGYVGVRYELEARLVSAQGTYVGHVHQWLPFMPHNRLPATQPSYQKTLQTIRCESRRLLPSFNETSFRSRAKTLMLKNPVVTFRVVTEVPSFAVAGEPFPLYLGLQYDATNSTTMEMPPVYLRSVKIRFVEIVRLGLRQPVYTSDKVQTLNRNWQITFQHDFGKDSRVRITEHLDLRDFIPPERLMVDEVAFETLNIKRKFIDAFVALVVTCAGNEYDVFTPFGNKDGSYFIIAPAAPPKGIELAGSNWLPSEAQGEAIYETDTKAAASEFASEPIYEAEARIVRGEIAGKNVHRIDSKIVPSELPNEPIHELETTFRSVQLDGNQVYELSSSKRR